MEKAQGYVENGNLVITVGGVSAAQKAMGSYPQAQVAVYNTGTLVLSTIYSDNSSTPKANPFTSATNGYFFFYALNGRYDITFSGGGLSAPLTFGDVLLADPFAAGGVVTSFNGRTGAIVPANNDYTARLILSLPQFYQYDYNFTSQATPENLSPTLRTVTMTPVPLGVNGTDTTHYLGLFNNAGTWQENVLINGGSATSGGTTGTLTFASIVGTYATGAYKIGTATTGLSETIWGLPSGGGEIITLRTPIPIYAPVTIRAVPTWVTGAGQEATIFTVQAGFPTGATGVFNWITNPAYPPILNPGGMRDFSILFIQPDSATFPGAYTAWPPAFYLTACRRPYFENINVQAAWDGFKSTSNDGLTCKNITISFFHRGFDLDGQTDTVRLEDIHAWPTGLTSAQDTAFLATATTNVLFYLGNVQDFKISNLASVCGGGPLNAHTGTGGCPVGQISNVDADTIGTFRVSDGVIEITNLSMSMIGAVDGLVITGGLVTVSNLFIYVNVTTTGNPIKVRMDQAGTGAAAGVTPGLILSGGSITQGAVDVNALSATTVAGFAGTAQCQVTNFRFDKLGGGQAHVAQLSGTGTMNMILVGNIFAPAAGTAISLADDNYHVVSGNNGGANGYAIAGRTKTQWFGNVNFAANISNVLSATNIAGRTSVATFAALQTENYIASETGANNAIAGALVDAVAVAVPLATGLKVVVQLAHTLQAGANTFNLNGGGALGIKSSRNVANNIGTAYAATGVIILLYDGTRWLDVSQ